MDRQKITGGSRRALRQPGFTLVELMIVTAIIGILAAMAFPFMKKHIRRGNLAEAAPYLLQIASKNRQYQIRNGSYYSSAQEQELEDNLGVNLSESADFCYVVLCVARAAAPTSSCTAGTGTNLTTYPSGTATTTTFFQVMAVLRAAQEETVTATVQGTTCTPLDDTAANVGLKLAPRGWVSSSGIKGKVVILQYPPPPDGVSGGYDWVGGLTYIDAMK